MLDTNVINRIADDRLNLSALSGFDLVLTHVQFDEIGATPESQRLSELIRTCEMIDADKIPTTSSSWDISAWDNAAWGVDEFFGKILSVVTELDAKRRKRLRDENRKRDALIGATAIVEQCILISGDRNLLEAVRQCGGLALNIDEGDLHQFGL
jgi:predicted nucleic acid-binding protein